KSLFTIDSLTTKEGQYSLNTSCEVDCQPESYQYAMEVFHLRGKAIRLTGFVKGESLKQAVNISIHYAYDDGQHSEYLSEEVISSDFSGSFDWTPFTVSARIPSSAKLVSVKINRKGEGYAWIDDLQLYVDRQPVRELPVAKEFTKDQMEWFSRNIRTFSSPLPYREYTRKQATALHFIKEMIGNSRIVALGESTHGTHEFFTLKHKVLQYAVEELGFRVFAIEDHQLIVKKVDEYIKSGKGTATKSMVGMFDVWRRQEVIDLIEWLRAYNIEHPEDMVSFIGFDMQNVKWPIRHLREFLAAQDSIMLDNITSALSELEENAKGIFFSQDTLQKKAWINKAQLLFDQVAERSDEWLQGVYIQRDRERIHYGLQSARLMVQFFQEGLHNGQMLYRDEAMADNLNWYLDMIQPEAKVIVWAHDVHISRGEHPEREYNMHTGKSMGSFLARKYKKDFKSFGLTTFGGKYRAFKTYAYQDLIESPLYDSPRGTIEEALHQISRETGNPYLFLPLNNTPKWLDVPVPVRFANHISFDYGFWPRYVIPYQFDGLFFIDQTTASLLLE
ncbi:MAG: erythromycin esterase family protein, partial [Cyclobacteriaceae bacterium]